MPVTRLGTQQIKDGDIRTEDLADKVITSSKLDTLVGAVNGQVLSYDSGVASGIKWITIEGFATTEQGTKADRALPFLSFTNEAVMTKLLIGFVSVSGTITSSDTLIQGVSKINGNILLKANLDSPTFTGTVRFPSNQIVNEVVLSTTAGPNKFLSGDGVYKEVIVNGVPVVSDAMKSLMLYQSALATQNQTNLVTLINNTWN